MRTTIKTRMVAAPRRTGRSSSSAAGFWVRLGILVQVIALLAGIFVLYSYRVSLGQKLTDTARETARVKQEIHELDRELEALRVKRETFTDWPYVKDRIERYGLNLRPTEPAQRRRLVLGGIGAAEASRVITAQR